MKTLLLLTFFVPFLACGGKPLNIDSRGTDIIAFGDSLTEGYGVSSENSYPSVLSGIINKPVINLGISGDTAADGLARMREIGTYKPYMVLIEFSANDMMRNRPFTQTKQSLTEIVEYVQGLGAIAVIVDTGGAPGMGKYTDFMKQLAKEKNTLFVPAIMEDIFFDRALKSDQIHPNEKGYKMVAERINKVIEPYVK